MQKTIQRYQLQRQEGPQQIAQMPFHTRALSVAIQGGQLSMWAEVQTGGETRTRTFQVYQTGEAFDRSEADIFIGSIIDGNVVWHVYELMR